MLRAYLKITKETVDHRIEVVADQPSRSFLLQFPSLMARQWMQTTDTCKDTAGQVISTYSAVRLPFHVLGSPGYGRTLHVTSSYFLDMTMDADGLGMVIGTDPAAVQPDQYALISQIRSGETAGKVMYCGTHLYGLTINATTDEASFKVVGIFHNIGGGNVSINEVGIYANGASPGDPHPNEQKYGISRDVVSTIVLADAEFLRVEYTIGIAT
jgi:hypothetical protein